MQVTNLWQLFTNSVKITPDNLALIAEDREFTYKQLYDDVINYSYYLQAQGVGH